MDKSYKLAIFDVDWTLYGPIPAGIKSFDDTSIGQEIIGKAVDFIKTRLSVPKEEAKKIRETVFKKEKYVENIGRGLEEEFGIPRDEYFSYAWDIDPAKHQIEPDPELKQVLDTIPYNKAALSASPPIWIDCVLARLGIKDSFDYTQYGDIDIRKPSKEAYLQVTNHFNVKPEDAVMFEDNLKYLKIAKELGMTTVLIDPEMKPESKPSYVDYCVPNIREIRNLPGICE